MQINEVPMPEGGREYRRTIACAWCGGPPAVEGTEQASHLQPMLLGEGRHGAEIIYRCLMCGRPTALIVSDTEGGVCYVVRYGRTADQQWVHVPYPGLVLNEPGLMAMPPTHTATLLGPNGQALAADGLSVALDGYDAVNHAQAEHEIGPTLNPLGLDRLP